MFITLRKQRGCIQYICNAVTVMTTYLQSHSPPYTEPSHYTVTLEMPLTLRPGNHYTPNGSSHREPDNTA